MTIPVEIMLRGNENVFQHSIVQPGDPAAWTEADVAAILKDILLTIDRLQNPEKAEQPDVSLRGLSWIVHPTPAGIVIAMEIHTAAVVAGPLSASQPRMESLMTAALRGERPADVVH